MGLVEHAARECVPGWDPEWLARAVDEVLAEIERDIVLERFVEREVRGRWSEARKSVPLEAVARIIGVEPRALSCFVGRAQRALPYSRVRCPRASTIGWCLLHDDMEKAVARYHPDLVDAINELRRAWRAVRLCSEDYRIFLANMFGDPRLAEEKCGIRSYEEFMGILARAQSIAEELGISPGELNRYMARAGNGTIITLDDGTDVYIDLETGPELLRRRKR